MKPKSQNVDAIVTVFISHTVFNLANTYIQQKYEVCTSVGCVTLMCIRPLFHLWNGNEYYKVLILHLRSPVICFFCCCCCGKRRGHICSVSVSNVHAAVHLWIASRQI